MDHISQTPAEKKTELKEWLGKTKLDSGVVSHTLGIHADHINSNVLLESSKKLIKINKLEVEPDNRDDIRYNTFHSIEDFVKEHVDKDAGKLQLKAKMRMQQKKDLSWLHPGFFSPQVRSVVTGNRLSQNIDGHNPIDNYDVSLKVTKLGDGGIASEDAVPDETRQVNSSYFGFLDPFHVAETKAVGVDHRFSHNVIKGRDNKIYRLVLDKHKKPAWVDHETLLNSKVQIPEY